MTQVTADKYVYTMQELADLLEVTLPTVRRWIKEGELFAMKIGHTVRIPHTELDRLLQKQTDPNDQYDERILQELDRP